MNDTYALLIVVAIVLVTILVIKSIYFGGNKKQHRIDDQTKKLKAITYSMRSNSTDIIKQKEEAFSLFRAEKKLLDMLKHHIESRDRLKKQWREHYATMSWWDKITTEVETDLDNELITRGHDRQIQEIETAISQFESKYGGDLKKARSYFSELKERTNNRIQELEREIIEKANKNLNLNYSQDTVTAAWIASLSIPISITGDVLDAHQVYDALRSVNSNFAEMNDAEIWWETLFMSGPQLSGLISLTKGAYLERLVADGTGGELHEHFNHADTDIVIDGVAYQIKATDSVSYIQSVDNDIPVIATSEVADITDSIDSGFSNEEISQSVELALGGSVVDFGDTAVDAFLTGAGSLGFFATCRGINHANEQFEKGIEADLAILEGVAVATKGTAKGVVDLAEMSYKVTTSAPSRAVGRGLWATTKFISRGVCKILP